MANIFSFLAGVLVGAVTALLYAPTSGEELRAQIRAEAEVEREKLNAEWHRRMDDVQRTVETTRADLEHRMNKVEEEEAPEAAEAAEAAE
jgi:gas vesicle protein